MELCFVFVLQRVLIIKAYFSYCWAEEKVFSAFHTAPPVSRMGGWEGHKKVGEGTFWTGEPKKPKGYPTTHDIMPSK